MNKVTWLVSYIDIDNKKFFKDAIQFDHNVLSPKMVEQYMFPIHHKIIQETLLKDVDGNILITDIQPINSIRIINGKYPTN